MNSHLEFYSETKKSTYLAGNELYRYLDEKSQALLSLRDTGIVLAKTLTKTEWFLYAVKRDDMELNVWIKRKMEQRLTLKHWQLASVNLPTSQQVEYWSFSGISETITGEPIEPDGVSVDGTPSWNLFFSAI